MISFYYSLLIIFKCLLFHSVWFYILVILFNIFFISLLLFVVVITHLKSAQDRFVSDVREVLTSFESSNIIFALLSDPTETIILAGDHAVKSLPSTQNSTVHA